MKTKRAVKPIVKFSHDHIKGSYNKESGQVIYNDAYLLLDECDFRLKRTIEMTIAKHFK